MINPHANRELEMMADGTKNLAHFFRRPTSVPVGFHSVTFLFRNIERTLIYREGHEHLVSMWLRAHSMHARGLISSQSAHARCGWMLGYTKDHIRDFLKREEQLR